MNRYLNLISGDQPTWIYLEWVDMTVESRGIYRWECRVDRFRLVASHLANSWCGAIYISGSSERVADLGRDVTEEAEEMKVKVGEYYRENLYRGAPSVVVGGLV